MSRKKHSQVLIFGASNTYGAWDELGGWADRLKHHVHRQVIKDSSKYSVVFNLGIDFGSTTDILNRLENEYKARVYIGGQYETHRALIFDIGGNDALYYNKEQKHGVDIKTYEENLKQLLKKARELGAHDIFCLSGAPYDESKTDPIPWVPEASYLNEHTEMYDGIKKKVCNEEGAQYIDVYTPLKNKNYKDILSQDGVHLSSKGHELIFEIIKDIVFKKKQRA